MNTPHHKTTIAATVLLAVFTIAGAVSAAAQANPQGAEARLLHALLAAHPQDPVIQQKLQGLAALEAEEARLNASKHLSSQDSQKIAADKAAAAAEHASRTQQPVATPSPVQSPFSGILDAAAVPNPLSPAKFTALNYWGGTLNGKPIGVFSGYNPEDPSKGVLVVLDEASSVDGTSYATPAAPMPIVSANAGILTLRSSSGEMRFELATRRFLPTH